MMLMKILMIISIQVSGFIKKEKTHPDSCLEKMFTTDYTTSIREPIAKSIEPMSNRYNYLN